MYKFFYDETEHSRKINFETISAPNYCDNFVAVIIGWPEEKEEAIISRYLEFEEKYTERKVGGELKSQTMKSKDFKMGFASLNKNKIGFYEDLLALYNDQVILYFSVSSKIEYVINQLFVNYHNNMFVDMDLVKYSIIKAINVYRPKGVLKSMYSDPKTFVDELRTFLIERIKKNLANPILKAAENSSFKDILLILDKVNPPESLDWDYYPPFRGFKKYMDEMNILDYSLVIDREGEKSNTLKSAQYIGIKNSIEGDSKDYVGIRMADMYAGVVSKMMQSLSASLNNDYQDGKIQKTLLSSGWFALNQNQLNLYKKMHKTVCEYFNSWDKVYSGIYSDDLVAYISLLQFMNEYKNSEEIRLKNIEIQPEYYNTFVCTKLAERYQLLHNKLPFEPIMDDDKDFFLNQRGAKVYKNIEKQEFLSLSEGQNRFMVLSVGFSQNGIPLLTILDGNDNPICYRLPTEYQEWVFTVVGMANMGEKFFPGEVIFSVIDGKYYVDIL